MDAVKRIIIILVLFSVCAASPAFAFWVWTPETNQWVNPKYSVKDTPKEQLDYAMGFYQAKDYEKALAELNKLISHYPKAREAADAQYQIGLIQEEDGQFFLAFKSYQIVIEKYPFSDRAPEIIKRQYDIGNRLIEGQDKKNKFISTVVGGDYNVIDVFRTVIKNAPYGELAAPAQYKIGLYLQEKQLYQEARDEFEKVINDYPNNEWAKAAKYQIALSDAKRSKGPQYDQAVTKSAVEEFNKFVEHYPEAELSQKAHDQIQKLREKEAQNNFVIAEFYEKQRELKSARLYYETVANDYQNTSWAQKALTKIRELSKKIK